MRYQIRKLQWTMQEVIKRRLQRTIMRDDVTVAAFTGDGKAPIEALLINGTGGSDLKQFDGIIGLGNFRKCARENFEKMVAWRVNDELVQVIREFCTVGFSAHGNFTKVGEFQEDLYN